MAAGVLLHPIQQDQPQLLVTEISSQVEKHFMGEFLLVVMLFQRLGAEV